MVSLTKDSTGIEIQMPRVVQNYVEAGGQAVTEWIFTGVDASTHKETSDPGCSVYWVKDGLITEGEWRIVCVTARVKSLLAAPDSHYDLLQLRVLRFGLLQDGDVGVGVFP